MIHVLIVGSPQWQDEWAVTRLVEGLTMDTVVWHRGDPRSQVDALVQKLVPVHGLAVARFPQDLPGTQHLPASQRLVAGLMRMDTVYVLGLGQADRTIKALVRQARQHGVRIVRVTATTGLG